MVEAKMTHEWAEYVKAVESGDILEPDEIKVKKVIKYEFDIDNALDNMDLKFG